MITAQGYWQQLWNTVTGWCSIEGLEMREWMATVTISIKCTQVQYLLTG